MAERLAPICEADPVAADLPPAEVKVLLTEFHERVTESLHLAGVW